MRYIYLIFLTCCLTTLCWSADARKIKGQVCCEKKGMPSVIVTDGKNFSQTKHNGTFKMEIEDNAKFVYIITPSGYAADWKTGYPQFYQRAADKDNFRFDLIKTGEESNDYHLIAVGDPQPRSERHFKKFAGKPLEDICATGKGLKHQVVGIAAGDICFDVYPLMENWKKEIIRTGFPFYVVPGNHDHDRQYTNDIQSIEIYNKYFGPENHAFHIGKDLVLMLDNIIYHARSSYEEGYTDAIIDWVKGLMKYISDDADIYVVQHSPINGRYHRNTGPDKMITNHGKLLDVLSGHKVLFISGHNHINGNFQYGPKVTEHNLAAICGTWWDIYHCIDGTPSGYKVYTKQNDQLSWYYKSVGKEKDYQYQVFRPGETRKHPDCIVINLWDYDDCWSVKWLEDGKDMGNMKRVEEYSPVHAAELSAAYAKTGNKIPDYRQTIASSHYFAAKPSENAKTVTILIKDRFGNEWKEVVEL